MPAVRDAPVLTTAALGRATLARQLLLAPGDLEPVAAIERIGGLQAQEPASPYLGLWTRLSAFDPAALDAAFQARTVVKATLMRATLHAVSARDYASLLPAVLPMLQSIRRGDRRRPPEPDHLRRLTEVAAAFTTEPRTLTDLREHMTDHAADLEPDEIVAWE